MGKDYERTSCDQCGSSDAGAIYDDGFYCFSCGYSTKAKGGKKIKVAKNFEPIEVSPFNFGARKISASTMQFYSYGQGNYKGEAVQVANYYKKNTLVAQHYRTKEKNFFWEGKSKGVELFGQRRYGSEFNKLIITEGELDAMSVFEVMKGFKIAIVSLSSGCQNALNDYKANYEFIESFKEVLLGFDNDEPGRKATEEFAKKLTPGKCKVIDWGDYKDASDIVKANNLQFLHNAINNARIYRPDGILTGEDCVAPLLKFFKQGITYGHKIEMYPKLNEIIRGIYKGKIYTFTAGTGVGKSTLVSEIAYSLLMQHNLKVGYIALEENEVETCLRMMSLYANKRLHIDVDKISEKDYVEAMNATINNGRFMTYRHFGSIDKETLSAKIRYMALAFGADIVVFDHISIATSGELMGESERRTIDILMDTLRSTCENTGVGILAICHVKKSQDSKNEVEDGGRVSLGMLRGSGSIAQISDYVIALNVSGEGRYIEVLKNRVTGRKGKADRLFYDIDTGRLEVDTNESYRQPDGFKDVKVLEKFDDIPF